MATGVLIMGVGKGTKRLQGFLECTKTYEAVVLFGVATDTYDVLGKVLRKAKYGHVTRERVEKALGKFRGMVMQRPPIYSALRVQGKRLYEYAREGKEVPTKIQERPVEVEELDIMEWMDGGSHNYSWPKEEAEEEAKDLAKKALHLDEAVVASADVDVPSSTNGAKRKRSVDDEDTAVSSKRLALEHEEADPETLMSGGLQSPDQRQSEPPEPTSLEQPSDEIHPEPETFVTDPGPAAVRLRMTVTSGFYVRSLSHDLGEAVGSLACMSELVRTRQGEFELGKNVLEYEQMDKGEEVWGPEIEQLIDAWEDRGAAMDAKVDDRSHDTR
jgi:tRNA pseudouridine55 synthase